MGNIISRLLHTLLIRKPGVLFIIIQALVCQTAFGAIDAKLTPIPDPPETGKNELKISLQENGKPVSDSKIDILFFMSTMGTMPRMESTADIVAKGDGNYVATYQLFMGGTWEVAVNIEKAGAKQTLRYSLTTGIPGFHDKSAGSSGQGDKSAPGSGQLDIGVQRLQRLGVRFAEAKVQPLQKILRTVGVVEADNTTRSEVTLRFPGYVQKQLSGRVGDMVKKGQPLITIYSPELVTAQNEFLLSHDLGGGGNIHESVSERLKNIGFSQKDFEEIRGTKKAKREIVITAPISGTILEVNTREGSSVNPGDVLYVIGDLSKTFIVARVFQQDLTEIKIGGSVQIFSPESEEESYQGRVTLLYPNLTEGAGTGNVRVVPDKFIRNLRPGLYLDLRFPIPFGEKLVVPSESILFSGMHRYVFVDKGDGVLDPREVQTGKRTDGLTEIRSGLKAGERVAASGTFLLSSEAQLRSALPKWKKAGGDK